LAEATADPREVMVGLAVYYFVAQQIGPDGGLPVNLVLSFFAGRSLGVWCLRLRPAVVERRKESCYGSIKPKSRSRARVSKYDFLPNI